MAFSNNVEPVNIIIEKPPDSDINPHVQITGDANAGEVKQMPKIRQKRMHERMLMKPSLFKWGGNVNNCLASHLAECTRSAGQQSG